MDNDLTQRAAEFAAAGRERFEGAPPLEAARLAGELPGFRLPPAFISLVAQILARQLRERTGQTMIESHDRAA